MLWRRKENDEEAEAQEDAAAVKRVAILGMAPTWRDAPFDDESWDIWGLNHLFLDMPDDLRVTAWFELHDPARFVDSAYKRTNWLADEHPYPIYMHPDHAEEWGHRPFPRREIERAFPRGNYHAISFDWLLALALLWGYEEIAFYGIHGLTNGEPVSGRACFEYWCGYAEASGVKILIPTEAELCYNIELRGGQYAFDQPPDDLGVLYLHGGVVWRKLPGLPEGVEFGEDGRDRAYLRFPAAMKGWRDRMAGV